MITVMLENEALTKKGQGWRTRYLELRINQEFGSNVALEK